MALDTSGLEGGSLLDYVDASLKEMEADLMPADAAMVGVIRKAAMLFDLAEADGKALSGMNYLSYVSNGMEKLGGSLMARKALGVKPEKPKTGLAAVRGIRDAPSAQAPEAKKPAARKPRAPRSKGA